MELRILTPEDQPALKTLMSEAFAGGSRPTLPTSSETHEVSPSLALGIFDGSRLVAAATTHHLHVTWGDADKPLGGVAGVACTADQRGRGHVARLLQESLVAMRDNGEYLSGLYPFAFAFYRKHGWDWVGEKRRLIVPTSEIPSYPEGRSVRSYDGPEARELVQPIYEAFSRCYRGMTTRRDPNPKFWDDALSHKEQRTTYVQVYIDPQTGAAEGYLTFRYSTSGGPGQVGDFFATTPAAYRGLLSVLHYYGAQIKHVEFSAPTNTPLPLYVMHWDLETRVNPLFMGRIVDVAAALSSLTLDPDIHGRIILQVSDQQCSWNNGIFALSIEVGHITVTPTHETPGISLDIQTLSQAYWGQPSLPMLRAADRLSVSNETQYQLLTRVLPYALCYLQDFF